MRVQGCQRLSAQDKLDACNLRTRARRALAVVASEYVLLSEVLAMPRLDSVGGLLLPCTAVLGVEGLLTPRPTPLRNA